MGSARVSRTVLLVLAVLVINEQCMTELLFPFAPFMVADFHITTPDKVGYFVGLIASAFGLAQVLSCLVWGYLADRFGRKRFLLLGSLANAGTVLAFGFSVSLWQAILFHALTGILSGNNALIRSVIGDVTTEETAPTAWAVWAFAFGIGRVIATAVGGFLARPALFWPDAFPPGSLFAVYPYLFPCLLAACLCLIGFGLTAGLLPETLRAGRSDGRSHASTGAASAADTASPAVVAPLAGPGDAALHIQVGAEAVAASADARPVVTPWAGSDSARSPASEATPLLSAPSPSTAAPASLRTLSARVVSLWFFSQLFIMTTYQVYDEIFTLWSSADPAQGGLGFSTRDAGLYFAAFGVDIVVVSLAVYPPLGRRFRPMTLYRVGTLLAVLFFFCIPLAREALSSSRAAMWSLLLVVSFVGTVSSGCSSPSMNILVNEAAPHPTLLGRLNGILQAAVGLARVVGPTGGGALVAWSLHNGLPLPLDYHFTYWLAGVLMTLVLLMSFLFPGTALAGATSDGVGRDGERHRQPIDVR